MKHSFKKKKNSLRDDFKWNTLYTYIYICIYNTLSFTHYRWNNSKVTLLSLLNTELFGFLFSTRSFFKIEFLFFFFFNIPFFVVDIIRYVGNSKFGVQHIFYFIWNRISLHASNERYNAVSSNKAFTRSSILPRQ